MKGGEGGLSSARLIMAQVQYANDRIDNTGFEWPTVGENIRKGYNGSILVIPCTITANGDDIELNYLQRFNSLLEGCEISKTNKAIFITSSYNTAKITDFIITGIGDIINTFTKNWLQLGDNFQFCIDGGIEFSDDIFYINGYLVVENVH